MHATAKRDTREVAGTGKVVTIRYAGGLKGEKPVDVVGGEDSLTVMLGDMKLPRGVEMALEGMRAGEEKDVEIEPEFGYGDYQDALAQWYPRVMLKDGYDLKCGDFLYWTNPQDGTRAPAWVVDGTDDQVRIDFNHPFAGKTLAYHLELVDVR